MFHRPKKENPKTKVNATAFATKLQIIEKLHPKKVINQTAHKDEDEEKRYLIAF